MMSWTPEALIKTEILLIGWKWDFGKYSRGRKGAAKKPRRVDSTRAIIGPVPSPIGAPIRRGPLHKFPLFAAGSQTLESLFKPLIYSCVLSFSVCLTRRGKPNSENLSIDHCGFPSRSPKYLLLSQSLGNGLFHFLPRTPVNNGSRGNICSFLIFDFGVWQIFSLGLNAFSEFGNLLHTLSRFLLSWWILGKIVPAPRGIEFPPGSNCLIRFPVIHAIKQLQRKIYLRQTALLYRSDSGEGSASLSHRTRAFLRDNPRISRPNARGSPTVPSVTC